MDSANWVALAGLPDEFGHWHRVYVRYSRWGKKGAWAQLLTLVSDVPGLECLMVDGSIVRVHQHGAAKKNTQGQGAMDKSRGGLSTKIHAADGLGNPVRLLLTAGQVSEHTQAEALIAGFSADVVMADKGHDSDAFVEATKGSGATPAVPPRSNRIAPRDYDKDIYKERNLVERFFKN